MVDYTEQTITIRATETKDVSITAKVANGLAYHQTHYIGDIFGPDYTITHIQSGRKLCEGAAHFSTPGQCEKFIAFLNEPLGEMAVLDWQKPMDELNKYIEMFLPMRDFGLIVNNAISLAKTVPQGAKRS
jgi:hypothetical protein